MAYTRLDARKKLAELLSAHEFMPGRKTFQMVWPAPMKNVQGMSPVAMIWDGPLWISKRSPATQSNAGLRVAVLVRRDDGKEVEAEDRLDRSVQAVLDVMNANVQLAGYWEFLEFGGETFLDFPPIETGTQYRREIIDLRAHLLADPF